MDTREFHEWLAERFDRIENKLDIVQSHSSSVDVTLARQAADIAHHIRRTDLLETRLEQVAADIKPIKDHVTRIKGMGAFVVGLGIALGVFKALMDVLP